MYNIINEVRIVTCTNYKCIANVFIQLMRMLYIIEVFDVVLDMALCLLQLNEAWLS